MPDTDDQIHLTTAEVARLAHASPESVTRWARAGMVHAARTLGGQRRYPAAEVVRLLNTLDRSADQPPTTVETVTAKVVRWRAERLAERRR